MTDARSTGRPGTNAPGRSSFRALLAAGLCLAGGIASAHPISVVTESAFVERDHVTVDVEIFAEDLYFYHDLEPNDARAIPKEGLRAASERHGPLLLDRLPVFDSAGRRIEGRVASVTGTEFPADIVLGELMAHSLVYRLEYPLAAPPEFLTFAQRLVDGSAGFPAIVDLRVRQSGLDDGVEASLKPGQSRTARFDWAAPPADPAVREAWLAARREDALGATSLNTIRSFLYVAKREVRHELLIPFPLVESFLTIGRAEPDFLTHDEQQAAKPRIGEFFAGKNVVSTNGVARTPADIRVEFFTLDDRNLAKAAPRRTVSALNSRVGLILTYPTERPARDVKLVWNAFNRQAWRIDAFCFAGDDVLRPEFSAAKRKDTFVWTRPPEPPPEPVPVARLPARPTWTVPALSVLVLVAGVATAASFRRRAGVAAGVAVGTIVLALAARGQVQVTVARPLASAPEVPAAESDAIARTLHANLYQAADAATDEEVVEALAAASDGDLLRDLVLQIVRGLRSDDEGGGALAIQEVRVVGGEKREARGAGFGYAIAWEVTARLEHWGHVHDRRYRYEGLLRIEPRDGRWALTDIDLDDVRLIEDTATEAAVGTASEGEAG